MNKSLLLLILGTCIVILSVIIISIGPITNKLVGDKWGYLNCEILSDQINLLKNDVTKLKKMKNLCYRQKAMHDMEYTSFIINIILGFVCADLALIHYLGFGKEFEIKTGIIGLISGGIGLSLLTEFIKFNKGKFQIISGDGIYEVGEKEKAGFLDFPFPGTIVNMEFRTDDSNSYRLSSESDNTDDIF